jgi:putative transposase
MDISDERWAEAFRREATIRSLAASERNDIDAIQVAANGLGLSRSQLYRLIKAFREKPVTQSLVRNRPGPPKGTRFLLPEIEDVIARAIDDIYKRRERPPQQKLIWEIRADCKAAGLEPPSRKSISARLAVRPPKDMLRAREGAKAANDKLALVRPGQRPTAPLDIVQIDHTLTDVQLVSDPDRAPLGRAWLTLLLDVHSRCVLGFTVSLDSPSAAGVALAITQGVLLKDNWLNERRLNVEWPVHGIPKQLHLDNAKEFHSRALKRGAEQYGISVTYRPPGKPRFGGHIERLMGTLMKRIQALPGSTSSNVVDRGDYPSEQRAVLTLRKFELVFAREVLGIYHQEVHSELSKPPLAAWREGLTKAEKPRLPANDPKAFVLDFLPFEERFVGRQGVRLFNISYSDPGLSSLVGQAERKRRIKYDPRDMSAVFVEMPDGNHTRASLTNPDISPFSLWEHRNAIRSLKEHGRRAMNEDAISMAIMANRQTLAEAQAMTKAARRANARSPLERNAVSIASQFAPERQKPDLNGEHSSRLSEGADPVDEIDFENWERKVL